MIKMNLIIKILFVHYAIIITFMIATYDCFEDVEKVTSKLSNQKQQQQQQQQQPTTKPSQKIKSKNPSQSRRSVTSSTLLEQTPLLKKDIKNHGEIPGDRFAEFGDPKFVLECPVEQIIVPKDNLPPNITEEFISREQALIKDKIRVNWFKDGDPWVTRGNGNHLTKLDKFTYALYQVGEADAALYTCLFDYAYITRNYTRYFEFYTGASFVLKILYSLPDDEPKITHPPTNFLAKRGDNITFTCNRATETLSHQTTVWFKSCPFSNITCNRSFNRTYSEAVNQSNPYVLTPYFIDNNKDTLELFNVTDETTGHYGCAVRNARGIDIRLGKLELLENWLKEQQEAGITDQLLVQVATRSDWIWFSIGLCAFLAVIVSISGCLYFMKLSVMRDKKYQQRNQQSESLLDTAVKSNSTSHKESNLRQHLPSLGCTNIYNISKSADGFITGHLHQTTGHLMAQSICSNILDKENPSISSSNSQQSDEASSSWGKSLCSHGDNCRALYLHTSNTTATTVPMYDHPPSNGTLRQCNTMMQNSCVINPTYGFLRPENDAADWAFPRRNLDRLDKIGEGQFGEVWRYIARQKDGNGDIVAVKQLKHRIGFGDRERLELIAEIEIMKSVNNHPNVIKLLHYCVDEYEPILLIMEYAEHGKLQTYLRNCRASNRQYGCIGETLHYPTVTSKELIKFTYHIAKGMEYVASQGIVHRDLASRNILVSKEKVCKVADFGFARRVNDDCAYERTTANPVPVKWMAPEALVENKFTSKSDVFSLGILMWEIVTLGATPYEQLSSENVYKKVTTGGRLERPAHCSDEFYNLMAQCWLHDPALRPSFKEVACELEKLLLSDNDYIKLDQYPEHAYYNIISTEEKEVVRIVT